MCWCVYEGVFVRVCMKGVDDGACVHEEGVNMYV